MALGKMLKPSPMKRCIFPHKFVAAYPTHPHERLRVLQILLQDLDEVLE